MHPALSTSYLLPAIFLNPVLFLHGLNTILSRIVAPILDMRTTVQPPPYSTFGPSASRPHLDVHASDNLCWSYTLVMICAQLMAFGRVHRLREESKEQRRLKKARAEAVQFSARNKNVSVPVGHKKALPKDNKSGNTLNGKTNGSVVPSQARSLATPNGQLKDVGRYSRDTSEESEIIL